MSSNLTDALGLQALGLPVEVETSHGWLLLHSWEAGRLHRLLAAHPERRVGVPDWAVPSFDVVRGYCDACAARRRRRWCDHAIPLPITAQRPARTGAAGGGGGHGDLRLEDVLVAVAAAGSRPMPKGAGNFRAQCPICILRGRHDRRLSLTYRPDRPPRVHCFGGCSYADLVAVLGLGRTRLNRIFGEVAAA